MASWLCLTWICVLPEVWTWHLWEAYRSRWTGSFQWVAQTAGRIPCQHVQFLHQRCGSVQYQEQQMFSKLFASWSVEVSYPTQNMRASLPGHVSRGDDTQIISKSFIQLYLHPWQCELDGSGVWAESLVQNQPCKGWVGNHMPCFPRARALPECSDNWGILCQLLKILESLRQCGSLR